MHRRFALLSILTLAAGSTALLPGTAAQASQAAQAAKAPPAQHAAADSTSEQRQVTRYWTEQRMESAKPLDLPAPKNGGKSGVSAAAEPGEPTEGTPWQAPPTGGQGGGRQTQSATSPGAPWTAGGAVVKTTGRIFFTYQGRSASCSGSAVTSANKSVVLTAGHCVKMGGAFHTNWV
ncbi:MAG: peptidase, partial [Nonomuraea sp.]|nr:peptidase [Nonomuraea sp.]